MKKYQLRLQGFQKRFFLTGGEINMSLTLSNV